MVTGRPLVSIGMPVYNGERSIGQALESVLAQAYPAMEVVISDNCSTDGTSEVCLKYAARDERIRYSRNTTNIGVTKNFLRVLELATGEFFMWACSDDIRPASSLDSLMAAMLRSPQAVMAHGQIISVAIQSSKLIANQMHLMKGRPSERVRAFVKGIEHNAMLYGLYRTDLLKRACSSTAFIRKRYGHDYHLCLQMCLLGPVEYSAMPMIIYKERTSYPSSDPMGPERPVTLWNVLAGGKAVCKSWVTLLYGYYYLLRPSEVSLFNRVACANAFGAAFLARYRGRLLRDAILILTRPVSWIASRVWAVTRRSPILLVLGRKLKGRLAST